MAFECDASALRPGSIVLIEKPLSSSGRPTYPHYFVVMHVPEPLNVGDRVPCLGITSRVPDEAFDPEQHVSMRWLNRKSGDPATGLSKPSVATVNFRHTLTVKAGRVHRLEVDARHEGKYIKADHFHALTALANAYNRKLMLERESKRSAESK